MTTLFLFLTFFMFTNAADMFDVTLTHASSKYAGGDSVTIKWTVNAAETCITPATHATAKVEVVVMNAGWFSSSYHTRASAVDPYSPTQPLQNVTVADGQFVYTFPYNFKRCDCGKDLWFNVRLLHDKDCQSKKANLFEFDEDAASLAFTSGGGSVVRMGTDVTYTLACSNLQGYTARIYVYESVLLIDPHVSNLDSSIWIDDQNGYEFDINAASVSVQVSLRPTVNTLEDLDLYFRVVIETGTDTITKESTTFEYVSALFALSFDQPQAGTVYFPGEMHEIKWHFALWTSSVPASATFTVALYDGNGLALTISSSVPKSQEMVSFEVPKGLTVGQSLYIAVTYNQDTSYRFTTDTFFYELPEYSIRLYSHAEHIEYGGSATVRVDVSGFTIFPLPVTVSDEAMVTITTSSVVHSTVGTAQIDVVDISLPASTTPTSKFFAGLYLTDSDEYIDHYLYPLLFVSTVEPVCAQVAPTENRGPRLRCHAEGGTFAEPTTALVEFTSNRRAMTVEVEWLDRQCLQAEATVELRVLYFTETSAPLTLKNQFTLANAGESQLVQFGVGVDGVLPFPVRVRQVLYPDSRDRLEFLLEFGGSGEHHSGFDAVLPITRVVIDHEPLDCSDKGGIVTNPPTTTGVVGATTTARVGAPQTTKPAIVVRTLPATTAAPVTTKASLLAPDFFATTAGYAVIGVVGGVCILFIVIMVACMVVCVRSGPTRRESAVEMRRSRTESLGGGGHGHRSRGNSRAVGAYGGGSRSRGNTARRGTFNNRGGPPTPPYGGPPPY